MGIIINSANILICTPVAIMSINKTKKEKKKSTSPAMTLETGIMTLGKKTFVIIDWFVIKLFVASVNEE